MKNTNEAANLARCLRLVMEEDAKPVSDSPDVSGVGVAWREGTLKFVVQTDRIEKVERLKTWLPSAVKDFPVTVEVAGWRRAAAHDDFVQMLPTRRLSLLERIARLLPSSRRWLAVIQKRV